MTSFVGIVMLLTASLYFEPVQTYVAKKTASYLSEKLHAKITLERVYFKPFTHIEVNELIILDTREDTLLYAEKLNSKIDVKQILLNRIIIEKISSYNSRFNYQIYEEGSNLDFLKELFPESRDKSSSNESLQIKLNALELYNNHFTLLNHNFSHHNKGVDFSDLELSGIDLSVRKIRWDEDSLAAQIEQLKFQEKSGFQLREFTSAINVSASKMEFKDLFLQTNSSTYSNYLLFEYENFKEGFRNFVHNITISASIRNSYVDSRDIEYFAPDMQYVQFKTGIEKADFFGKVDDFHVQDLQLYTKEETSFGGNISVRGLPDINRTLFDAEITDLHSNITGIESLVSGLADNPTFALPEEIHTLQDVSFAGTYRGKYNDFIVGGHIETERGNLDSDMHIQIGNVLSYEGNVNSEKFQIGAFLNNKSFDEVQFDLAVKGEGLLLDELDLRSQGELYHYSIDSLYIDKTEIDMHLVNRTVDMYSTIEDEKLSANVSAFIDFNDTTNIHYELEGDIGYAHLKRLNLIKNDSIEVIDTQLGLSLSGNSLNYLQGQVSSRLFLQKGNKVYDFEEVKLTLSTASTVQKYSLRSTPLDLDMEGDIDFGTLPSYFKSLATRYAPAIGIDPEPYNPQNFTLDIHIKSYDILAPLISDQVVLANNARLYAYFSSDNHLARFTASSPFVNYKGVQIQDIEIAENADEKDFSLMVTAERVSLTDSIYVKNVSIHNVLAKDSLQFSIKASEKTIKNYFDVNGYIYFAQNKPADILFENSTLRLNNDNWEIHEQSKLSLSKGKLYVDNLKLKHDKQQININGILSDAPEEKVRFEFENFNLASLDAFTNPLNFQLGGNLNGIFTINSAFGRPHYSTNIRTTDILYNNRSIGKLDFFAELTQDSDFADIEFNLLNRQGKGISAQGYYKLGDSESLHIQGKLNDLDLFILQPFLNDLTTDIEGKINSNFQMEGTLRKPVFYGEAELTNTSFKVNYLQVPYFITKQKILVNDNKILFNDFAFKDESGNSGNANGSIDLNNLLDIAMDLRLSAQNLLMLNTTFKDNNLYYGTAYGSGNIQFTGSTSALNINMTATSDANTKITLPFNASSTLENEDFIYFKSLDKEKEENSKKTSFKGVTMRLDLEFTQDAEVSIHTDMGELSGDGNGEISMVISSLGDFEMFGDYVVNSGKFHFTAQDLFNKYFEIEEGATLRWTGEPAEALINMKAVYQQRTSVSPLYNAAGQAANDQRVQARADMILQGNLSRPDISFDLTFPQDPYIKDELQGYLSDVNNVNQQALSLIVRRSFTPSSTEEFGKEVNNTLLSAGTEIAFNQLNSILSQSLNMDFFDLNIRSLNDASASIRFFDDRLILTGGIADYRNQQITDLSVFSDRVATDAELIYKLRKDGNLIFRANNRLNTRNFLLNPNDEYISAVGLVYRQEFGSISEFWRKLWTRRTPRKKNESRSEK